MSGSQTFMSGPGNWVDASINGLQYKVLLPANYSPTGNYPVVLYLHQLDMGNYPDGLLQEVDPWWNSSSFRTDHPAIVVMPLLDQSADPSGGTINWGGVSTADSAGETNAIAALKQVMAQYSADPTRVYVTGNSMGGIGTEDMLIKFNAYTGTEGKIFAAGLALAGADYGQGYPQPNQSVVTGLKNVPFWAIHGGQDTTVPLTFDQNLYAAEQAIGGKMIYTQDNALGHDVWDTYYPKTGNDSPLSWLFSQKTGGQIPPPPLKPQSPNDTVVLAGSNNTIIDAAGNTWSITGSGQVAVNGATDATTNGVIELAYVDGKVWQENSAKLWWGKASTSGPWAPDNGTSTSPLPGPASPDKTVILAGSQAVLTDTSGNTWGIDGTGRVTINGVADSSTANVTTLAIVNKTIWQQNTAGLWWGETAPNAGWSPGTGTTTSPIAGLVTLPNSQSSITVTGNGALLVATGGDHMVFIKGSGDTVALSGGKETITDTGSSNTYIVPPAGSGYETFTSNLMRTTDKLDLRQALAGTEWNGDAASIGSYLHITNGGGKSVLAISAKAGGSATAVTTIIGAGPSMGTLLAHALT